MITTPAADARCANCGTALQAPYCARCGQKAAPLNPTAHDLAHDVVHEFAHVDGRIVRSLGLLLFRPGVLSQEYFAGRRAPYVTPLRLYLIFSVLLFAVLAIVPPENLRFTCTSCSPELRAVAEEQMRKSVTDVIPRAMFLLVPVFAGLVALAARRSGRNYPLHLYFAMHVHAAWFAAIVVTLLAGVIGNSVLVLLVGGLMLIYNVVSPVLAFQRTYGTRLTAAAWRMGLVLLGYGVIVLFVLVVVFATAAARVQGLPIAPQ